MTRIFVTPNLEELSEAGLLSEADSEVLQDVLLDVLQDGDGEQEGASVARGKTADNVWAQWKLLKGKSLDEVLAYIADHFANEPQRRRELLTVWMAEELGYSRMRRRKKRMMVDPLWDVLAKKRFDGLSKNGPQALWHIASSMQPHRTSLHPMAALAAVALLLNSTDSVVREDARALLLQRSLPDEPRWLYELVGELADRRYGDAALVQLVDLALEAHFWEVAALLCAMQLVRKYSPWRAGGATKNLMRACDRAAEQFPLENKVWLTRMADAALGGRLSFSWLEKPVEAAIRLAVADGDRQQTLREFHNLGLYDADYRRLDSLYDLWLEPWQKNDDLKAFSALIAEVEATQGANPTRAQRLLELVAARKGRRVGSILARVEYAIDNLPADENPNGLETRLAVMYVRNFALESHAVRLVRRAHARIDWNSQDTVHHEDLEMYLIVSDYERAFEQLTYKFEGVVMEHADKNAAARTKSFVERRMDPSRITRVVRTIFMPVEWLGSSIAELSMVTAAVDHGMALFEARTARNDLTQEVLSAYKDLGYELDSYDSIATLPVDRVDSVLFRQRQRRILLGAVAGGISGGLAPFSWGVLSLADVPVMLGLTGDICSRFCWYYGFDPREQPDLPIEILAVALGGSMSSAIEPMLLRQNLREYVVQKSVVIGALTQGGAKHLGGRSASKFVERHISAKSARRFNALARRTVLRNMQRRAAEAAPSKTLPVVGAVLGATLNVALLYDICEAAQAVLTDRFLERKYPEWSRHIGEIPSS